MLATFKTYMITAASRSKIGLQAVTKGAPGLWEEG